MLTRLVGKVALIVMFLTVQIVLFSGLTQAESKPSLRDINGHWAKDVINKWIGNGLISGYADQTFQPNKVITRAEFVSLVNNVFGYLHTDNQAYTDVPQKKWFYNDVAKAKFAGYISGFDDGTFRPDQPASREQAAKIIYQL